jgi:DNA-binding LacI/PurR family transcriptional regulator
MIDVEEKQLGATPARTPARPPAGDRAERVDRVDRVVSLRDVAKEGKVSVATVSMVLNGNPRISRATSLRIQRLVERMGYQPNRLAQSLSSRYTNVAAVMLPALRHAFADAYFGEIISGICDKAGKLGYKVMLEQAKPEFIREKQHVRIFERRYVDGVLCLGTNDRHAWLADFAAHKCPAMIVDNQSDLHKLDYVCCDYRSGAEQVMNYLLQLGHRRIGLITAGQHSKTARGVRDVYAAKLAEAGIAADPALVADGEFTEEGGATAAGKLLAADRTITALFAGNDKMAIGAMHHLTQSGLRVPGDVSVVGFDDLRHAAFVNPTLSTIHLPLYEVGAMAMERLVERIHGRAEAVKDKLSTHLVVRNSTAMARSVAG